MVQNTDGLILVGRDYCGIDDDDNTLIKRGGRYRVYHADCKGMATTDYYVDVAAWDESSRDLDYQSYCLTVPSGLGEYIYIVEWAKSIGCVISNLAWQNADEWDATHQRFLESVGTAEDEF